LFCRERRDTRLGDPGLLVLDLCEERGYIREAILGGEGSRIGREEEEERADDREAEK